MLFDLVSNLTGGLINDLYSLIAGALVCSFLAIAVDILLSALNNTMQGYAKDRNFEKAQDYLAARNRSTRGTASYDYYNLLYHRTLRKSV